jgi:hypothetical protein
MIATMIEQVPILLWKVDAPLMFAEREPFAITRKWKDTLALAVRRKY